LGWTSQSTDHLVGVSLRSTGDPVGCDPNDISGLVSFSYNSVFPTGDRSAVGSCRGPRYKCARKVFTYLAFCVLLHSGQPENSFVFVTNVELYQCNRTNNMQYLLSVYFDQPFNAGIKSICATLPVEIFTGDFVS
jgi:hypothetical protein